MGLNMVIDEIADAIFDGAFETETYKRKEQIIAEFAETISKYNLQEDSNTPDVVLARYLFECLLTFHLIQCRRSAK